MLGNSIVPLLCDYNVKEVKSHTFKLKHNDNTENKTFNVRKLDGTTIEVLFNTVLSFQTMSSRMNFTGTMMYSYFIKCLLDNGLEEWWLVTPHEDDQTPESFKFYLEERFSTLLPDNAFLTLKEWMTNTMKKPFVMRVKDFGNRLKTLNQLLTLIPHDKHKDMIFSDNDLKALLLKSMPTSWQYAYLLKGTCVTDDFCKMLAYFVQFQSITDTHTMSKSFSTAQELSTTRQYKYTCTNHGQSGCSFFLSGRSDTY